MSDCVRRAVQAGLRYAGRNEDVSWIPDGCSSDFLPEICDRLGLTLLKTGDHTVSAHSPVLVCYRDVDSEIPEERIYHAVFVSDILPMLKHKLISIVIGWDDATSD